MKLVRYCEVNRKEPRKELDRKCGVNGRNWEWDKRELGRDYEVEPHE